MYGEWWGFQSLGSEAASNHSFGRLRSGQLLWFTAYKPGERKMGRLKERITIIIESYNRNCRFCITVFFRRKSDSTTFNVLSFVRPSFCHQNPSNIIDWIFNLHLSSFSRLLRYSACLDAVASHEPGVLVGKKVSGRFEKFHSWYS